MDPDGPPLHQQVSDADARALIRLLGQAATLEGGHQTLKRFIMDGLCELIEADCWIWTLACDTVPGNNQAYTSYTHGGFSESRFADLLTAIEHPDMGEIGKNFYLAVATKQKPVTMLPNEIDPNGVMQGSDCRALWQGIDIGPVILSGYPLDPHSFNTIGVYRKWEAPPFGPREKQMLHTLLTAVPWLHQMGWPEDRGATVPRLHPKQRIVLNLLMEGWPRKSIAAKLKLSENTLAGYAREIYRHFGVHSQIELMHRFLGEKPE